MSECLWLQLTGKNKGQNRGKMCRKSIFSPKLLQLRANEICGLPFIIISGKEELTGRIFLLFFFFIGNKILSRIFLPTQNPKKKALSGQDIQFSGKKKKGY